MLNVEVKDLAEWNVVQLSVLLVCPGGRVHHGTMVKIENKYKIRGERGQGEARAMKE